MADPADDALKERVWIKKDDDDDLHILAWVTSKENGQVVLEREHLPAGAPKSMSRRIAMDQAAFDKLAKASAHDVANDSLLCKDLVALEDPSEPTMLHILRDRYEKDCIFTAIGPVLIAVNPYKSVSSCKAATLSKLARMPEEELPAHAFAIANAAYDGLVDSSPGEPQSVLVSGESGAGKTETTKLLVACLAMVSSSSGAVVEAALESGLLLEAFGNARTVYNNNSSRFGKWCAVHFDERGRMASCRMQAFLLEQSRIVRPAKGERNYHIFYHMLKGANEGERRMWSLLDGPASKAYAYLEGEETSPAVDDHKEWGETQRRLNGLGFAHESQRYALFRLLSAVLGLGNLKFQSKPGAGEGDSEVMEPHDGKLLGQVAVLMQVGAEALDFALTHKTVVVGGDKITVPLQRDGCVDARDAIAKAVYSAIFGEVVDRVNLALASKPANGEAETESRDDYDPDRFIGLLDIFGFENFGLNGFEQLCINFTNEKLQQFFMDALIKREKAEYAREGIEFGHIEYPDNSAQVQLIDDRKGGLFAILDDECRAPKGSDSHYVQRLHDAFAASKPELYAKPKLGRGAVGADVGSDGQKLQFVVKHYAEDVQYTAFSWLEKNRGRLNAGQAELLATSESPLLQNIAPASAGGEAEAAPRRGGAAQKQPTVSGTFRASLNSLAATMLATHQHFIRCIKPNPEKVPGKVDGGFMCRQLRYLGVHAVVEINRVGFPVKQTFEDFVRKFRCIAFDKPSLIAESLPPSDVCVNLLAVAGLEREGPGGWEATRLVQIGKTKVFLRNEALPILDKPRRLARNRAAACVQKFARRRIASHVRYFVRIHRFGADAVRTVLDRPDPDSKAATIQARIGDAGLVLDELIAVHDQSALPMQLAPSLVRCAQAKDALELELRALAVGLEQEMQAASELDRIANGEGKGSSKESFMALKAATARAHEVSENLTEELRVAIAKTEAQIEERFKAIVAEWEAEVKRQEEQREAERRERTRAIAESMQRQIERSAASKPHDGASDRVSAVMHAIDGGKGNRRGSLGGVFSKLRRGADGEPAEAAAVEAGDLGEISEPSAGGRQRLGSVFALTGRSDLSSGEQVGNVTRHEVKLRNGLDPSSAERKQLLGCSPTLGIHFSEVNAVARLVHSGTVAQDGMIHVADVVLAVDGIPCDGRKVAEILDELQKPTYMLTVGRPEAKRASEKEGNELPVGEHAGWLHLTRARNLFVGGLTATGPSHKSWANLEGGALTLYEERVRGEARVKTVLSLDGAVAKAPPSSKRVSAAKEAASNQKYIKGGIGGGFRKGSQATEGEMLQLSAAAAAAAKPKAGASGKKDKANQPAVMQELTERGLFPFRLYWPDRPKEQILVLAAHTSAERKGWVKALEMNIKAISDMKPTRGVLHKRKGRNGGLFKFGWSERWFELLQGHEATPPVLHYYEGERKDKGQEPKGVIVINEASVLMRSQGLATKQHEHVFTISTQQGAKTVTTVLACKSANELDKWTAAVDRALHWFKPTELGGKTRKRDRTDEEKDLLKKTAVQLQRMLEYMGAQVPVGADQDTLVAEVLRQRQLNAFKQHMTTAKDGSGSKGDLHKNLHRDEARLMHRTVDELKALLEYMEVDYGTIVEKHKLVALVINQKRVDEAASTAQRIYRKASASHLPTEQRAEVRKLNRKLSRSASGMVDVS